MTTQHRDQVEIKIHKNDYLTISFIGDIDFAGRWYGTAYVMREKLRSRPAPDDVLDDIIADINTSMAHYPGTAIDPHFRKDLRKIIESYRISQLRSSQHQEQDRSVMGR